MRGHPAGRAAACIGRVIAEPGSTVMLSTLLGGNRILDMHVGEPLLRIC
jgi:hydrogenase expression/formation protein HypE